MISASNITKSFGNLQVLKGISLNIDAGEVVSIVGASGAGKTTLCNAVLEMFPDIAYSISYTTMQKESSPLPS